MAKQAAQIENEFLPGPLVTACRPILEKLLGDQGKTLDGMTVRFLSQAPDAIVTQYSGDGWSYVLKAFNPANPDARTFLDREFRILNVLAKWPLVPNLVVAKDTPPLMVTEFVDGVTLDTVVTEQNLLGVAERIGSWYSIFADAMPKLAEDTNWAEYLARYDDLFSPDELEHKQALLSALPIRQKCIAKNDPVLKNFIRATDGNLVGLDFAAAAMKPVGWDLLVTARHLTQRFPDHAEAIAQALVKGWRAEIDGNAQDDFAELVTFFAEATANRRPTFVHGPIQRYRENYAAAAKADPTLPEAAHVFRVPTYDNELEPVAQEWIEELRAALTEQAEKALATPLQEGEAEVKVDWHDPTDTLVKACTLCAGGCCRRGKASFAYIKDTTMRRLVRANPDITVEEMVDHYIAQIPAQHITGSCLYHTETGCALPRDSRSNICNRYVCRFGRIIENSSDAVAENPGPVLLVGIRDGVAQAAELHDGPNVTPVDPAMLNKAPDLQKDG
jgi:hypothetical protein